MQQEVRINLTGKTHLLMHNDKTKDPLNIYTKVMKPLSSKKTKTDSDHEALARIEWESGLYLYEGSVQLEGEIIEACFRNGCKKNKKGTDFNDGVRLAEDWLPLSYGGPTIKKIIEAKKESDIPIPALDKFYPLFFDRRPVNVQRNSIIRTRPIFRDWSLECTLLIDEDIINIDTVLQGCKIGGSRCGICERRVGHFGLFDIKVL